LASSLEDVNGTAVPRRSTAITWVELDGEAVLYDEATGAMHRLNLPATAVWVCCDGSASLDELIGDLSEAFLTSAEAIEQEVTGLVRDLVSQGLLEMAVEPADRSGDGVTSCREETE
jgi:hypothetical protein